MTFFSFNVLNVNSLKCVSLSNQECKARPKIIDVNNNELVFYPYSKYMQWKLWWYKQPIRKNL